MKFISIILLVIFSILLWIFVSLSDNYSTSITVPVILTEIPEGYAIKELSDQEITLNIKGEGWQLAQLTIGLDHDFSILADKPEKKEVVSVRNAIEKNTWIKSNIQVALFSPEQISYELEKINYKKVKIHNNLSLNFKPGHNIISDIKVEPDSVIISGPKSKIQMVENVTTENKTLDDLDRRVITEVMLENIPNITFHKKTCTIEFDVQRITDKTFDDVFVESRNVPPSRELSLYPNRIKVILRGGIGILGKLTNKDIKVYINFRQALEDTLGSLEPLIEIPEFTSLTDARPRRLEYIIKQF
ncbi:hypothetical protein ACFLS9_02100 [Bacteroidota bacterium]